MKVETGDNYRRAGKALWCIWYERVFKANSGVLDGAIV